MLSCFTDVINLEKQLKNLANNLTEENLSKETDLLKRYDILQEQLMNHKNYHYKSRMRTVLFNLDFTEEDLSKKNIKFFWRRKNTSFNGETTFIRTRCSNFRRTY